MPEGKSLRETVEWVRSDLVYAAPEQLTRPVLLERFGMIFEALDREKGEQTPVEPNRA